ncbi:hypothetical protein CHUAL_011315 [Chamberlinius hualienensis]
MDPKEVLLWDKVEQKWKPIKENYSSSKPITRKEFERLAHLHLIEKATQERLEKSLNVPSDNQPPSNDQPKHETKSNLNVEPAEPDLQKSSEEVSKPAPRTVFHGLLEKLFESDEFIREHIRITKYASEMKRLLNDEAPVVKSFMKRWVMKKPSGLTDKDLNEIDSDFEIVETGEVMALDSALKSDEIDHEDFDFEQGAKNSKKPGDSTVKSSKANEDQESSNCTIS